MPYPCFGHWKITSAAAACPRLYPILTRLPVSPWPRLGCDHFLIITHFQSHFNPLAQDLGEVRGYLSCPSVSNIFIWFGLGSGRQHIGAQNPFHSLHPPPHHHHDHDDYAFDAHPPISPCPHPAKLLQTSSLPSHSFAEDVLQWRWSSS